MNRQAIVNRHCEAASEPMVWGVDDCCQWVRRIIVDLGGPDLMADTPRYSNEAEALEAMNGCLVQSMIDKAKAFNLERVTWPYRGDDIMIGIVAGNRGATMALRFNGAWVARAERGVSCLPDRFCVMAWRV